MIWRGELLVVVAAAATIGSCNLALAQSGLPCLASTYENELVLREFSMMLAAKTSGAQTCRFVASEQAYKFAFDNAARKNVGFRALFVERTAKLCLLQKDGDDNVFAEPFAYGQNMMNSMERLMGPASYCKELLRMYGPTGELVKGLLQDVNR